ncbi:MAG: hypothetical protein E2O52_03430 [Gammaproteobacteria bacterium]|nr:MAG: hypothetical protein E2O52_03430 [Gammaproteobacteria bacterium]
MGLIIGVLLSSMGFDKTLAPTADQSASAVRAMYLGFIWIPVGCQLTAVVLLPALGRLIEYGGDASLDAPWGRFSRAKKERPVWSLERRMPPWGNRCHQGVIENSVITGITMATTISNHSRCWSKR